MNDTAGYAAWLIESVQKLTTHIRELIERGDKRYSGQPGFSGLCYSPDLRVMFTWSTDGQTFASDDDGATWIEQDGVTTETDEGAFVAGREPAFVPWLPSSVKDDAAEGFVSWPLSVTMDAACDIVTELPTLTNMYAPKQPCPRDSGYWYCDGCIRDHLKEQSEREWPILVIQGCGEVFGARICGVTHLGFVWCEECAAAGRIEPHPHVGEHEVVARMAGGCEESQPMYSLYWRGGRPEIVLTE